MAQDALIATDTTNAKDKRPLASPQCRPKHVRGDRPAMNQSPKLSAVPATSPMSLPNQSSRPGGVGAPQMPLILFRSAGALILLGALISVFLLDCLRYRRGNAGYHRRQGAPCRAPVLIRQDSRNAARSSQTTAARLAWSLIISQSTRSRNDRKRCAAGVTQRPLVVIRPVHHAQSLPGAVWPYERPTRLGILRRCPGSLNVVFEIGLDFYGSFLIGHWVTRSQGMKIGRLPATHHQAHST